MHDVCFRRRGKRGVYPTSVVILSRCLTLNLACEWCGQPAVRLNPTLCAECAYKFWARSREVADSPKARLDGAVYSK